MAKHIFIFVPAFGNNITTTTFLTVAQVQQTLAQKAIGTSLSAMSFPDIAELRSMVTTIWYDTMPNVDYLCFIDSDMGFSPDMLTDMILFDEPIVGAIYPQRRTPTSWAGSGTGEPQTERRGNFMKVEGVGMGCTLIRRDVVPIMLQKFPELVDERISLHPAFGILKQAGCNRLLRLFEKLDIKDRGIVSEDLSFCIRWNQCGGTIWAAINYNISHVGYYDYVANYLQHANAAQQQETLRKMMEAAQHPVSVTGGNGSAPITAAQHDVHLVAAE